MSESDVRSELIRLVSEEFNRGGLANSVVAPTVVEQGVVAPAQMLVPIGDPGADAPVVHVYFLPDLADPPVLQYMVLLGYELAADTEAAVARFVALANSNLPITGFELSESLGQVVFRHTHAVSTEPLQPNVIAWTLTMIGYAITEVGPMVRSVAAGAPYEPSVARLHAFLTSMGGS